MSNDEILSALLGGDSNEVRLSLRDCGPNAVIEDRPVLHWVVSTGNDDAVSTLLAMGADPNGRTEAGDTALISAAYLGELKIVQLLIQAGADVDAVDADGQGALMAAAKGGHLSVAEALIEAGANVACVDARGRSVLHWAVIETDNEEVIQYLLAKGAPKDLVSADGFSAHDYAVKLGRPLSVAQL
jgi:uncharacterized protein